MFWIGQKVLGVGLPTVSTALPGPESGVRSWPKEPAKKAWGPRGQGIREQGVARQQRGPLLGQPWRGGSHMEAGFSLWGVGVALPCDSQPWIPLRKKAVRTVVPGHRAEPFGRGDLPLRLGLGKAWMASSNTVIS